MLLGSDGAAIGIPLGLCVGDVGANYAEVEFTIRFDWIVLPL
ncbi:hypothetical protein [Halorhabdus salina]|nr:hypothetical protein [Halorhabdus salina]